MNAPRFGVNYTPRSGWFHHWLDFDAAEVRADLEVIAALGMDHVRIFPIWPYVQPNRTLIRPRALDQLAEVVTIAGEAGLDVSVDGIQGHLSSFDFLPAWTQTWHRASMFSDPVVISGLAAYLEAIAGRLADLPNFLGMSLGNEVSQFSSTEHPEPHMATPAHAHAWAERMLAACEAGAPGREHQISEYDRAWFSSDHPFTPAMAARLGSATTIHSWVFNGTAARYGNLSEESVRLAEYLIELGRGWATDPARPIWLQEIGAPMPPLAADQPVEFLERSLAHALDTERLWGVTWWCSHDVSRELADFPALEYDLGLIDSQNRVKPVGRAFAAAAATARKQAAVPAPRSTAVVLDVPDLEPGAGYSANGREVCAPGGEFFEAWMRLAIAGGRPTAVLASRVDDAAHLAQRGITEVVHPADLG
ncbi:cellulase family glycosylhydrolase [Pseudactinotalea sp. HY158]|uniref:glycoside hydrolase 5 family protein n=1 Tax=Pseudactinotalea sp. HY158 TaxID=2654547 RepID=UPI00129D13E5|nr:cellulase family glycosylhydrolase [Pseudactinotalea sp. HY158]QGH70669.1 cellulase family glycosylhydrolase [Pseudactinotalea sp. HY158]